VDACLELRFGLRRAREAREIGIVVRADVVACTIVVGGAYLLPAGDEVGLGATGWCSSLNRGIFKPVGQLISPDLSESEPAETSGS
jgi:hypothetical protein